MSRKSQHIDVSGLFYLRTPAETFINKLLGLLQNQNGHMCDNVLCRYHYCVLFHSDGDGDGFDCHHCPANID